MTIKEALGRLHLATVGAFWERRESKGETEAMADFRVDLQAYFMVQKELGFDIDHGELEKGQPG